MIIPKQQIRTLYYGSLNKPLLDYVPLDKHLRPSIFSRSGMEDRMFRLKLASRTVFSLYYLWRALPRFSIASLKQELASTYLKFIKATNGGDFKTIASVATPGVFQDIKKTASASMPKISGFSIEMQGNPILRSVLAANIKSTATNTYRIFQTTLGMNYLITNKNGDKQQIADNVVFEFCPDVYDSRWRVCGVVPQRPALNE